MKKAIQVIIGVAIITAGLFLVSRVTANNINRKSANNNASISSTPANKLHTNVNQNILITVTGKYFKKLNYEIESADVVNEIIVNGQRIQSVGGKSFLVLNIKITNDNNQGIQINSRDYVRLAGSNTNEWYAPEIYNDPLEVQAISTKTGRIGFTVDNAQREFNLRIGEINGDKKIVKAAF
jgi:hypothetical protein